MSELQTTTAYSLPSAACSFIDDKGREVFLSQGFGDTDWGSFYRKPNGSLKKVRAIPMVTCKLEAAQLLAAYAARKNWKCAASDPPPPLIKAMNEGCNTKGGCPPARSAHRVQGSSLVRRWREISRRVADDVAEDFRKMMPGFINHGRWQVIRYHVEKVCVAAIEGSFERNGSSIEFKRAKVAVIAGDRAMNLIERDIPDVDWPRHTMFSRIRQAASAAIVEAHRKGGRS
jgi:hypothetical protein